MPPVGGRGDPALREGGANQLWQMDFRGWVSLAMARPAIPDDGGRPFPLVLPGGCANQQE